MSGDSGALTLHSKISHKVRWATVSGIMFLALAAVVTGCTAAPRRVPVPSNSAAAPTNTRPGTLTADDLVPDSSDWVLSLPSPTLGVELPAAQAKTGLSMPWKFVAFGSNRSTIEVVYVSGDGVCVLPQGFYVTTITGDVAVAAVSRSSDDSACSDKAVVARAWLSLPEPINRTVQLLHAPVDPQWNSPGYFD